MAWIQGAVLALAIPMLGIDVSFGNVVLSLIALGVTSFAMTALGIAFAWRCETTSSFHAVMNLLFLPMWMLSGAFFPSSGTTGWMRVIMDLNPLTWCTRSIRDPLLGERAIFALVVSVVFAVVMMGIATYVIARPHKSAA